MFGKALFPALVMLVLSSAGCSTKSPDDGTKPFQGTWQIFDQNGKNTNRAAIFEKDLFQFIDAKENKGGNSARTDIGAVEHGAIQVEPAKTPAHVDFVYVDGENAGKTRRAIFVFDRDKLKICIADFDAARPGEFAAREGVTLMIMERRN